MTMIAIDPSSPTLRSIYDPEPTLALEAALGDLRVALDDAVARTPDLRQRIWARIEAQIEATERNEAIHFQRLAS